MNVPPERYDAVMRLSEATEELRKARAEAASEMAASPEEETAEQRRNDAIIDLRRTDMWPPDIAKYAEIPVEEVLPILYEAGLAPEYEPVAERDLTIRPPDLD